MVEPSDPTVVIRPGEDAPASMKEAESIPSKAPLADWMEDSKTRIGESPEATKAEEGATDLKDVT